MPAKRSRTLHWRRCLEQIHERRGAIEIAIARNYEGEEGNHLIWRVRVLAVRQDEILVEQPMALGQPVRTQFRHERPSRRHGGHFPLSTSRRASTSSMELASSRFSLPFSASSAFSR